MTDDVTQSVEVDAPRERVWQLLTDPGELPRWWPDAAEPDRAPAAVSC